MTVALLAALLLTGCATGPDKDDPPAAAAASPRHVFYAVKTRKPLDIAAVDRTLEARNIGRSVIQKGWGSAWLRRIGGTRITVYASIEMIWVYAAVEDIEAAVDVLHALVEEAGAMVGAELENEGKYVQMVKWPKVTVPGKRIPEGLMVPVRKAQAYLSCVSKEQFRAGHRLDADADVKPEFRKRDLYWVHGSGAAKVEQKAAEFVREGPTGTTKGEGSGTPSGRDSRL
jgi:hypothetical protein